MHVIAAIENPPVIRKILSPWLIAAPRASANAVTVGEGVFAIQFLQNCCSLARNRASTTVDLLEKSNRNQISPIAGRRMSLVT